MGEWVSVDDEMPEEGETVIACLDGEVILAWWSNTMPLTWKEFSSEIEAHGDSYLIRTISEEFCRITHWMPLPDAPI